MLLFDSETAELFLSLIGKYKQRYGILIHSYCLMSTHPHVVLTSTQGGLVPDIIPRWMTKFSPEFAMVAYFTMRQKPTQRHVTLR
jgi:hypothetical protein